MLLEAKILSPEDTDLINDFYLDSDSQTDMDMNLYLDRSPDFLEAIAIHGFDNKVLAVIDKDAGKIAVACIVSMRHSLIEGKLYTTGYMSGMKTRRGYRGTLAFARFMRLFNEYWLENKASCWILSAFSDNQILNNLLQTEHQFFSRIRLLTRYNTFLFKPSAIPSESPAQQEIHCRYAEPADREILKTFLHKEYAQRNFTQPDHIEELEKGTGRMKDFLQDNLMLAFRDDVLVGTAGLWDQNRYRRWCIDHYSKRYKILRPMINWFAYLRGIPALPREKQQIEYRLISLLFILNDEPGIFIALLQALKQKLTGREVISLGLPEGHPFSAMFEKKCVKLRNNIYLAYKDSEAHIMDTITNSALYIEQGNL